MGRSVRIHITNLQILETEVFKDNSDLAQAIFSELLKKLNNQYNLRHACQFSISNMRRIFRETESLSYIGPKIWDTVPEELKELSSKGSLKKGIKKWKPQKLPMTVGYVDISHQTLVLFNTYYHLDKVLCLAF